MVHTFNLSAAYYRITQCPKLGCMQEKLPRVTWTISYGTWQLIRSIYHFDFLGDSKYVAATYRLFKTSKKPDEKCCCSVKYKGYVS